MSNHLFRKLVRVALIAALACGTAVIAANEASAATKVLSGTHSFGQVAAACGGSGGQFNVSASGGYGCQTTSGSTTGIQCNAKGQCVVFCSGKCPAVVRGLNGALRPPSNAGTAAAAGGTRRKNPPLQSVNQPVVQRSGGVHSSSKH